VDGNACSRSSTRTVASGSGVLSVTGSRVDWATLLRSRLMLADDSFDLLQVELVQSDDLGLRAEQRWHYHPSFLLVGRLHYEPQALWTPSMHPQSAWVRKWDPEERNTFTIPAQDNVSSGCGTSMRNCGITKSSLWLACGSGITTLPRRHQG